MRMFLATMFLGWLAAAPALATPLDAWLGWLASNRGEVENAERHYRQGASAEAHYNLGELLLRQERYQEAGAEFQKALELSSGPLKGQAAYNLGNSLFRQERLEESLQAYKDALRWNPRDEDARHNIEVVQSRWQQKKSEDQKSSGKQSSDGAKQGKQSSDGARQPGKLSASAGIHAGKGSQPEKQPGDRGPDPSASADRAQKGGKDGHNPAVARQASPAPISPAQARAQDAQSLLRYFEQSERRQLRERAARTRPYSTRGEESW